MPLMQGLVVGQSKIHGYGVIATRSFAKGERLCIGDGVMFHEDDDFDDTYALAFAENPGEKITRFYDLVCQTRWINHSCSPNSEVDTNIDPETKRAYAWWTALRDIAPGDELTYDYAFSAEVAERCFCGTLTCRGLIIDEDEVHLAPGALKTHLAERYQSQSAPITQKTPSSI